MSKVIKVPQQEVEFEAEHPLTGQPIKAKFTFKQFALICVRNYDFFGKGLDNIMQGADIVRAIEKCNKTLKFGESDHDKFWKAVEARQWSQEAGEACIPFIQAVKDAVDEDEDESEGKRGKKAKKSRK